MVRIRGFFEQGITYRSDPSVRVSSTHQNKGTCDHGSGKASFPSYNPIFFLKFPTLSHIFVASFPCQAGREGLVSKALTLQLPFVWLNGIWSEPTQLANTRLFGAPNTSVSFKIIMIIWFIIVTTLLLLYYLHWIRMLWRTILPIIYKYHQRQA